MFIFSVSLSWALLFSLPQWRAPWQCIASAGRRSDDTRKREPPCGVVRKSRRRGATVNGLSVIALSFLCLLFVFWCLCYGCVALTIIARSNKLFFFRSLGMLGLYHMFLNGFQFRRKSVMNVRILFFVVAANCMSDFTRISTPYLLKCMTHIWIHRKQRVKRCQEHVKHCMHRRKHFREKRSAHVKTHPFLVVRIYSVVFVDHNLVLTDLKKYYLTWKVIVMISCAAVWSVWRTLSL